MHKRLVSTLCAALVAVLISGTAVAGPLTTDPNAIPGWQGSTPFNATLGGSVLVTNVDYAVYAPGQFGNSVAMGAPGHTPFDPSGGTDYVYAYEILNTGGNSKVLTLSVGLDYLNGAVPTSATSIGHDPNTPELGTAPTGTSAAIFNPAVGTKQNGRWSWSSIGGLVAGGHSDILIFSSPFGPQMYQSTVAGIGVSTPNTPGNVLPSPTPEPTTAALAAIGGVCLLAAARTFRRRIPAR